MNIREFKSEYTTKPFLQLVFEAQKQAPADKKAKLEKFFRALIEEDGFSVNKSFIGYPRRYSNSPPINILIHSNASPELIEFMLQHGANPFKKDDYGMNAMHWALYKRKTEGDDRYVELLKKRGVPMPSIWDQLFIKKP